MSPGFLDVMILLPSLIDGHLKGGLFLEVKTMKGRASPQQKDWIERLNFYGYHAQIARGADEMMKLTEGWISRSPFKQ